VESGNSKTIIMKDADGKQSSTGTPDELMKIKGVEEKGQKRETAWLTAAEKSENSGLVASDHPKKGQFKQPSVCWVRLIKRKLKSLVILATATVLKEWASNYHNSSMPSKERTIPTEKKPVH